MKYSNTHLPVAAMSTKALGSFFAFGSLGSAVGRTGALAPVLFGRAQPEKRTVGIIALVGWLAGTAALIVLSVVGADPLPEWVKVAPTIATVQTLYGLIMGVVLSDAGPPYRSPGGLSPADLAFALYGTILMPPTALFVVTMTGATLLG